MEIWRAAWAAYTNRVLESAGRPERIDHRSYKRQGIDKIPTVHLGPAASQMEKRCIRTGKIRALQESAALFSFLQANGIQSMQQLHEKIADMNSCYYDLRGKIVKAERRKADGHACHEIHEGGFESSGTAPQNCRAAVPTGTG